MPAVRRVTLCRVDPLLDALPAAGELAVLAVAAVLIGLAKTAVGGLASISVAAFAAVLPARESTAAVLLLLLVGDVYAVRHYRQHADVTLLRRLLPAVVPGVLLGTLLLATVEDQVLRRLIGTLLLLLAVLQVLLWRRGSRTEGTAARPVATWATGTAIGFTTMVANAGGPVMTLYLLALGVGKLRFLGVTSWFFLLLNLAKVPFSLALGLFTTVVLATAAVLWPGVLLGAWLGTRIVRRISDRQFEVAVLAASTLAAVPLLL